jgi:hypothetical protein
MCKNQQLHQSQQGTQIQKDTRAARNPINARVALLFRDGALAVIGVVVEVVTAPEEVGVLVIVMFEVPLLGAAMVVLMTRLVVVAALPIEVDIVVMAEAEAGVALEGDEEPPLLVFDEPPSSLMLCQLPLVSPYEYELAGL